ncbi:uncharacterized protein LOC142223428 [Haematobia irritans]|uniref:uncharacterized protein LOC142223428 n=1 Tax=Haematobia irritans TaxID=7368 RepID=UPI003F4FC753
MRILRSHYLRLQKNANSSANVTNGSSSQGRKVGIRSAPYKNNTNQYDLRSQNTEHRTLNRKESVLVTNIDYGQQRRRHSCSSTVSSATSTSDASSSSGSSSSSASSSSSSDCTTTVANTNSSGYETSNNNNNEEIITLNENEFRAAIEKNLNNQIPNVQTTYLQKKFDQTKMRIRFTNVPQNVGKINVILEYKDVGPQWLTAIYRKYENYLWRKTIRDPPKRKSRWYYICMLCDKQLCLFDSLKSHLNNHLELYPYVCKLCSKQYTNRNPIIRHLKIQHEILNDFQNYIGQ